MNDDKIRYLSHQWVSNLHGKEFNSTSEEMLFQSYAYQDGYKAGTDWMQEKMIEKVAEWMRNFKDGQGNFPLYDYVGNLKQAMEEENEPNKKIYD